MSATVQGLVVVLASIVPLVAAQFFHITVSAADVTSLVTEGAAIIGSILTIRGLVMKLLNSRLGTVDTPQA